MAEWERWLFGFTKLQVFFILAMAIFIFALSKITEPIDTQTIEKYNNATNTTFTREYFVVQNYVNGNYMVLGYILLGGIVISFLAMAGKKSDMLSIEEAIKIINNYLKSRKSITTLSGEIIEIGNYYIDPTRWLLPEEFTDVGRVPYKYVLQVKITDLDGNDIYLKAYVHPFKGYIGGFIEGLVEDKEKCSHCGNEYDIKILTTEDYKKWKRLKEDFKRD